MKYIVGFFIMVASLSAYGMVQREQPRASFSSKAKTAARITFPTRYAHQTEIKRAAENKQDHYASALKKIGRIALPSETYRIFQQNRGIGNRIVLHYQKSVAEKVPSDVWADKIAPLVSNAYSAATKTINNARPLTVKQVAFLEVIDQMVAMIERKQGFTARRLGRMAGRAVEGYLFSVYSSRWDKTVAGLAQEVHGSTKKFKIQQLNMSSFARLVANNSFDGQSVLPHEYAQRVQEIYNEAHAVFYSFSPEQQRNIVQRYKINFDGVTATEQKSSELFKALQKKELTAQKPQSPSIWQWGRQHSEEIAAFGLLAGAAASM